MAYFLRDKITNTVRINIFYSSCLLFLFLEDFNKSSKVSIGINSVKNYYIYNGNRTEWSLIRPVTKLDVCKVEVRFVNHEYI